MADTSSDTGLPALFLAAQAGVVRIFGQGQLLAFADYIREQGEVIRNIETYEVRGELEIPRIDLGLYQGSAEDADRLSAVRLAASERRLKEIVADADEEGHEFLFQVWVDENG
jgi:hypothetical protein